MAGSLATANAAQTPLAVLLCSAYILHCLLPRAPAFPQLWFSGRTCPLMFLAYVVHTNLVKLALGLNSALCIELPSLLSSVWYLGVITDSHLYLFGIFGRIKPFFSALLLSFLILFGVMLSNSVTKRKLIEGNTGMSLINLLSAVLTDL